MPSGSCDLRLRWLHSGSHECLLQLGSHIVIAATILTQRAGAYGCCGTLLASCLHATRSLALLDFGCDEVPFRCRHFSPRPRFRGLNSRSTLPVTFPLLSTTSPR